MTRNQHSRSVGRVVGLWLLAVLTAASANAQPAPDEPPKLMINDVRLPDGAVGQSYLAAITAQGGVEPYPLWVVESGALPGGVTLDRATGVLSGAPERTGSYTFQVGVRDSKGTSAVRNFELRVLGSPFVLRDMAAPTFDGTVQPDSEYAGTAPFRFRLSNGKDARVWLRQHGGMLYAGFIIDEPFFSTNHVSLLLGNPDLAHVRCFTLEPFNPAEPDGHIVAGIVKRGALAMRNVNWINEGQTHNFAGLADAVHRDAWHAEMRINLGNGAPPAQLNGNPQMAPSLMIAFAVRDGNGTTAYSPPGDRSDAATWLSADSWHRLRTEDKWGTEIPSELVTPDEVKAIQERRTVVYWTMVDVTQALDAAERLFASCRAQWAQHMANSQFVPIEVDRELARFDRNNDGQITKAEWLAGAGKESDFDELDADKDGVVTLAELAAAKERQFRRVLGAHEKEYRRLLAEESAAREDYVSHVLAVVQSEFRYGRNYYALLYDVARRFALHAEDPPGGLDPVELWGKVRRFAQATLSANQWFRPARLLEARALYRLRDLDTALSRLRLLSMDYPTDTAILLETARILIELEKRCIATAGTIQADAGGDAGKLQAAKEQREKAAAYERESTMLLDTLARDFLTDGSGALTAATLLYGLGMFDRADKYVGIAANAALDPANARQAIALVNLFATYRQYQRMRSVVEALLAPREPGQPAHRNSASMCQSLASLFRQAHLYADALPCSRQALQCVSEAWAKQPTHTADEWSYRFDIELDYMRALADAGEYAKVSEAWRELEGAYAPNGPKTGELVAILGPGPAALTVREKMYQRIKTAMIRYSDFAQYASYWKAEQESRKLDANPPDGMAPNPRLVLEAVNDDDSVIGTIEIELFRRDAASLVEFVLRNVQRGAYAPKPIAGGGTTRGTSVEYAPRSLYTVIGTGPVSPNDPRISGDTQRRHFRGSMFLMQVEQQQYGTPFGIDTATNPWLNGGQPVIGRVVSGMDVVDRITVGNRIRIRVK
ncbi:MAG: putative Ig domain-containing protein [Planctomycetota bacterium]